jgi:diaminopimelate decarboxylase
MWRTYLRNILYKNYKTIFFGELPDIHKERGKIIKVLKNKATPLFMVDHRILEKRFIDLERSGKKNWNNFQIAYSFKTNYEIAKSQIFKRKGLLAEVVSGWEYQMAKKMGYKGREIVFNGPSKTDLDLKKALNDGALVFVDNSEELERIRKISRLQKKKFRIGIRLRSKIPRINESRFGFSINNSEASIAVSQIQKDPFLNLVGVHMHIGSDIDNPEKYGYAASEMAIFLQKNIADFENRIKFLDLGGGFPSHGLAPFESLRWNPKPIENYVDAISRELRKIFREQKPTLIFEPGRYLVDDAVFFVTRITSCKKYESRQILTTDATISMLPLVQYRPQIVKLYDKDLNEKKSRIIKTVVYGASCRENDILYNQTLPKANVGDFLIYFITGAYNQNMASEFIFGKPECVNL